MKNCGKCGKVYATVVFIIAIVLCYLVMQRSFDASMIIMPISRFIEVLLPVLGIGALIKYIACNKKACCCGNNDTSCNMQNNA